MLHSYKSGIERQKRISIIDELLRNIFATRSGTSREIHILSLSWEISSLTYVLLVVIYHNEAVSQVASSSKIQKSIHPPPSQAGEAVSKNWASLETEKIAAMNVCLSKIQNSKHPCALMGYHCWKYVSAKQKRRCTFKPVYLRKIIQPFFYSG